MKFLKVEVKNFKPYINLVVPDNEYLEDGFYLINGKNSVGKTSFIESILWGLLGDTILKNSRNSCIRNGQNNCNVKITFDIGGRKYRIIREISVKKSNEGKTKSISNARLFKFEINEFKLVTQNTTAVNNEIENMLGINAESIIKTIYVRQKEVDKLALAEPTDLRLFIMNLFGLDEQFEIIKKRTTDRIELLKKSIYNLSCKVAFINSLDTQIKKSEQDIEDLQFNNKNQKIERNKYEKELQGIPSQDTLKNLQSHYDNKLKIQQDINLLQKDIDNFNDNIKSSWGEITNLKCKSNRLNDENVNNQKELENYPTMDTISNLKRIIYNISFLNQNLKDVILKNIDIPFECLNISCIQNKLDEIKKNIDELDRQKRKLNSDIIDFSNKITMKTTWIDIKKGSIKHILKENNCPVCNTSIRQQQSKIILSINKEIPEIDEEIKNLNNILEDSRIKLHSVEVDLKEKSEKETNINDLNTYVNKRDSELLNLKKTLHNINNQFNKFSEEFDEHKLIKDIIQMESKVNDLNSKIFKNTTLYKDLIDIQIPREEKTHSEYSEKLSTYKQQKNKLLVQEKQYESKIKIELDSFSIADLNEFFLKSNGKNIKELILKIEELISQQKSFVWKIKQLTNFITQTNDQINKKLEEVEEEKRNLRDLEKMKIELNEKENELRHLQFLIGEIDGFVSKYVFERKLAIILKNLTNFYLTQLTNGRFTINKIFTTTRAVRYRESHGLEINLHDDKDRIDKDKDQLSGGDETSLGLALRLAISKLMARIKPFKDTEVRIPCVNTIILDEPMGSLDSDRREILLNMLTKDKSFKQIFLITHTDMETVNCKFINIIADEYGIRNLEYNKSNI